MLTLSVGWYDLSLPQLDYWNWIAEVYHGALKHEVVLPKPVCQQMGECLFIVGKEIVFEHLSVSQKLGEKKEGDGEPPKTTKNNSQVSWDEIETTSGGKRITFKIPIFLYLQLALHT